MASEQQVRQYLAYWFQLGKHILVRGGAESLLPRPVIQGDRYSRQFEEVWQQVRSAEAGDCYLEGTQQTIADLLSPAWEINPCCRCSMPVPLKTVGSPLAPDCTCADVPNWPNTEMPLPRAPVDSNMLLLRIRDRLRQASGQ